MRITEQLPMIALPDAPPSPIRERIARMALGYAARKTGVPVTVASDHAGGMPASAEGASLVLRDPASFYRRFATAGLVGVGESYQAGDWESGDLPGMLAAFAARIDSIVPPWLLSAARLTAFRQRPPSEDQTIDGARQNVRRHYALPNELFAAFLDETMCYSSAIFPADDRGRPVASAANLADAQRAKIDRLLDLAHVSGGTSLLEIGTGRGELPVRAAERGASVRAITNMAEHADLARARADRSGRSDRIAVRLCDYRQIASEAERYDAVVSVEMIEAVGRRYWPTSFHAIAGALRPDGLVALQAMTMRHDRMLRTSRSHTWIDRYIFPGGLIPSLRGIHQSAAEAGLRVREQDSFGQHYAATLALWRSAFNANWPAVAALGFDERFRRTWNFYLAYCEAGFTAGYLDVHQLQLSR